MDSVAAHFVISDRERRENYCGRHNRPNFPHICLCKFSPSPDESSVCLDSNPSCNGGESFIHLSWKNWREVPTSRHSELLEHWFSEVMGGRRWRISVLLRRDCSACTPARFPIAWLPREAFFPLLLPRTRSLPPRCRSPSRGRDIPCSPQALRPRKRRGGALCRVSRGDRRAIPARPPPFLVPRETAPTSQIHNRYRVREALVQSFSSGEALPPDGRHTTPAGSSFHHHSFALTAMPQTQSRSQRATCYSVNPRMKKPFNRFSRSVVPL